MLATWLEGLAAAAPARCAACGRWPSEPVCPSCRERFARPRPRCARCALPLPAGARECGACLRDPPPLDACHCAVDYGYPWSGLLAQYKFQDQPGWAGTFAALLRAVPGVALALAQADLLLPLPLAGHRLAQRGFNQAVELARRLDARKLDTGLLLRLRETAPQAALQRRQRLANVRDAFGVEPLRQAELRGRRVVLVDDVMTSGASLYAAARALRSAGAAHLTGLVVARTDERD